MEVKLQRISKHEKITLRLSFLCLHYIVSDRFFELHVISNFLRKAKELVMLGAF